MAKLTLAPGEDDSDLSLLQKSGSDAPRKFERLHLHFNPEKVGFGIISPLPDIEQMLDGRGNGIRLRDKSQNENKKEQR